MKRTEQARMGLIGLCVVAMLIVSAGECLGDQPRRVAASRASAAPVIDGKLGDACWKSAAAVTGFVGSGAARPQSLQTAAYVCYDDSNLYVAVRCEMKPGVKPAGQMRPHDSDIFYDDVVEVMIDPGRTTTDYYQFAINAYGATFDCARSQGGVAEDDAWNGDWQGKAQIGDGYWSAESAIPFYTLGVGPDTKNVWGINICRENANPKEVSSIAVAGSFNEALMFAYLDGIDADFGAAIIKVGQAKAMLDIASVAAGADRGTTTTAPTGRSYSAVAAGGDGGKDSTAPTGRGYSAALYLPVTNVTRKRQNVQMKLELATGAGDATGKPRLLTLLPRQTVMLRLEALNVKPVGTGVTNTYIVQGEAVTRRVTFANPKTGAVVALASVKSPVILQPLRITMAQPGKKSGIYTQTQSIRASVGVSVAPVQLADARLVVTLTPRGGGNALFTKSIKPSGNNPFDMPAASLLWGAYYLKAALKTKTGKIIAAAQSDAVVYPKAPYQVKALNGMVSELMNARDRKLLGKSQIEFLNPRDGWCFFSVSGGDIRLDKETNALPEWTLWKIGEAMRYLSAGRHRLTCAKPGKELQVIVRAIPELQYASLNEHPILEELGKYDLDWLERIGLLANLNVFVTRLLQPDVEEPQIRKWVAQGKRVLYETMVPGTYSGGNAKDAYDFWSKEVGMSRPWLSGLIGNEFYGHGGMTPNLPVWADAIDRLLLEHPDKVYCPYLSFYGGPDPALPLIAPLLENPRVYFANERYINEQPRSDWADQVLESMLSRYFQSWNEAAPGSVERSIAVLSLICAPPENMDMNPLVDFKVFLDKEFRLLATDPRCSGLRGIQLYYSRYADEEYMRWAAKLMRHYYIEGKTTPLTRDPYNLDHLTNCDFEGTLDGWTVSAAEEGSVTAGSMPGYGYIEGRYPPPENGKGDSFLLMKRSAAKANSVAQQIRNLTPGRLYSVRMYVADYPNLASDQKLGVGVTIDGGDMLDSHRIQGVYRLSHHPKYPAEKTYANFLRLVFRAKAKTAKLTISDWASPDASGGPVGQQMMINFVQVQPYNL